MTGSPDAYYIRPPGGDAQGPFPLEKVKGYIEAGRVRREMEFSVDGETWLRGDAVPALFPPVAQPPAVPRRKPPAPPPPPPVPARVRRNAAPTPPPPPVPGSAGAAPRREKAHIRRGAASRLEADDRRELNRVIATAHRNLRAVRGLFIADAILVGLAFLLSLATDSDVFKMIVGGLFVTVILCTIYVVRFPLLCSVVLAVFHTAIALPFVIAGIESVSGGIYVGLAFLTWCIVAMAANLQKLLRQYPDAIAAKRFRGEHVGSTEAGTKWRDQRRVEKAAQRKKLALFVGLPLALGITALFVFGGSDEPEIPPYRPPPPPPKPEAPLQPRLDAFRAAWNGQTLDEITAFFAPDVRDRKTRLLGKLFRRREWHDDRPAVTIDRRDAVVAHQVAIFWTVADYDRVMQTDWQWENGAWWLLDLKMRIPR